MILLPIVLLSFLLGSLPFSLMLARWVAGIDLRQVGSGNVGATNVARSVGFKWGLLAFVLDGCKGFLPVLIASQIAASPELNTHAQVLAGVAAVVGHMFPPWLGFKGGKGVATAFGVVLALAPWGSLAALATFLLVMALSRIVSLSSIAAVLSFGVFQLLRFRGGLWTAQTWSLGVFSIAVPLLIVLQHRANIVRLIRGEERRFSFSARMTGGAGSTNIGKSDGDGRA